MIQHEADKAAVEMQAVLESKLKMTGLKTLQNVLMKWRHKSMRAYLTVLLSRHGEHLKLQRNRIELKAKKLKSDKKKEVADLKEKAGTELYDLHAKTLKTKKFYAAKAEEERLRLRGLLCSTCAPLLNLEASKTS